MKKISPEKRELIEAYMLTLLKELKQRKRARRERKVEHGPTSLDAATTCTEAPKKVTETS